MRANVRAPASGSARTAFASWWGTGVPSGSPGLFNTSVFPSQLADLRSLSGSLALLRLYAQLSPDQRQALQAGKPLATAQLKRTHRWRLPLPEME
jgi:hypothetical protein